MARQPNALELSRRTFLATTSAALVGATWHGLVPQTEAAQRHPLERERRRQQRPVFEEAKIAFDMHLAFVAFQALLG
jgi:hypothetical protein